MTLTEFLLARILEDEELAQETSIYRVSPWVTIQNMSIGYEREGGYNVLKEQPSYVSASANGGVNGHIMSSNQRGDHSVPEHIVRWQPDRVLAECEAKRRIVSVHNLMNDPRHPYADGTFWQSCSCLDGRDFEREGCPTTLALALPYADHPDYQQEWSL